MFSMKIQGKRRNNSYKTTNKLQQKHRVTRLHSLRFAYGLGLRHSVPQSTESGELPSCLVPADRGSLASKVQPGEDMLVFLVEMKAQVGHGAQGHKHL
jgi:hypothetical protein